MLISKVLKAVIELVFVVVGWNVYFWETYSIIFSP